MAGPLEGIIVLTQDGRPVVHSHFANRIPTYSLLHSDYFSTLLAGINTANAHIASSSSDSIAGPSSNANKIYFTKDVKPVIWVPGVPDVNPLDLQSEQEEVDEEDDVRDTTRDLVELSLASQLSARISASRAAPPMDDANVWGEEDGQRQQSSSTSPQSSPLPSASLKSSTPACLSTNILNPSQRGQAIVTHAAEALAEQGAALVHLSSGPLRFLSPISREIDPLVPLTFLHSFITILQEYLTQSADPALLTEETLRDHFDVVYQLFEEILDTDGNILTTEPNQLKSLVLPPNWVGKLVKAVGVSGLASAAPPPLISTIPWRRANSKYTNNELYVDLVETLEGTISRSGRPVALDVWGKLECNAKLSGTPDLSLTFNHPTLVQDESFHPCVRYRVWRKEKRLSFVPPDGNFELVSFRVGEPYLATQEGSKGPTNGWAKAVPLQVSHCIDLQKGSGTALIQVSATNNSGSSNSDSLSVGGGPFASSRGKGADPLGLLEDVNLTFGLGAGVVSFEAVVGGGPMPTYSSSTTTTTSSVLNSAMTPSVGDNYGTYIYDPQSKLIKWTIPKLLQSSHQTRPALLKLTWTTTDPKSYPTHSSGINVRWSNLTESYSQLKVDSVNLTNTNTHPYRPFKGVRTISRGKLVFRV
ncbi:related to AP-3 adapter complex mu3A subunit [Melanopsichium pennsylvanicum]|uniref:Related to AP-3 adapter complex mu3A subunit n=2 Tax=Melanopsichium pennsylvanicum TaxID=63383 RepID=A0AAJ4XQ87_9BASI|nr:related to AP-3 adapter complex mu3A subunit [Melanopsichium pennsylvanicum 4]SNX86795.1 related to AP-3 adapter complex mu3A subunit [Melanopsichium pennsylvanicum]